jgi:hypothetical protein
MEGNLLAGRPPGVATESMAVERLDGVAQRPVERLVLAERVVDRRPVVVGQILEKLRADTGSQEPADGAAAQGTLGEPMWVARTLIAGAATGMALAAGDSRRPGSDDVTRSTSSTGSSLIGPSSPPG